MEIRWPTEASADFEGVRLLDADPDMGVGLSDADLARAREVVVLAVRAARGPWTPPQLLPRAMGAVVLEGVLTATGRSFARADTRLVGAGDTLDRLTLADPDLAWHVHEPARLALFDERFALAVRTFPALLTAFARRLFESQHEEHTRAAICTMPRVEERILALLCHLALRWGHVTPAGVTLALPVTHEMLGALVGARRPTVSIALAALTEQGLVWRRDDGTWLLPADCDQWPANGIPSARREIAA
jgi:CRP/FNR family transcriptional regulator, cyclic AMP receptor protein